MEAKGSKRRRVATIFCKSSSSRCPADGESSSPAVARVFSRNGRAADSRSIARGANVGARGGTFPGRKTGDGRERTTSDTAPRDSVDGEGPTRGSLGGVGRDVATSRCSSPPSCRVGGSFSTRATCAGSCPSRASGGAAMFVKTSVRARTRSTARESPSRASPPDRLTQLSTRISFETTGASEPNPRRAPLLTLPTPRPQTYATRATPRACR